MHSRLMSVQHFLLLVCDHLRSYLGTSWVQVIREISKLVAGLCLYTENRSQTWPHISALYTRSRRKTAPLKNSVHWWSCCCLGIHGGVEPTLIVLLHYTLSLQPTSKHASEHNYCLHNIIMPISGFKVQVAIRYISPLHFLLLVII